MAEQLAFTNTHGYVSDQQYAELRRHFSEAQVFELAMTGAALAGMAKMLFTMDLAEREDSCPVERHVEGPV